MNENKDIKTDICNKDELYKLYWEEGLTQKEIGEIYGKSDVWICLQMKKYNVLIREPTDIKTRFINYVKIPENPNDCWEWVGYKDRKGYGKFNFNGKTIVAHRVSFLLYKGEFDPTWCCLHKCDNPSCVNPNHLFLGNREDNNKDRDRKGRNTKGEEIGNSKLTEKEVKEIKKLLLQGISNVEIGKLFKVVHQNISLIKRGRRWRHIK